MSVESGSSIRIGPLAEQKGCSYSCHLALWLTADREPASRITQGSLALPSHAATDDQQFSLQ